MKKPEGYDDARATGEFTPVELGGHYATIKQVTEQQTSTGKDMIVVIFDFADQDAQKAYFSDMFKRDDREEKKWPFNGRKYIMVNDYNDDHKTSRAFKTFCTCAENSNNFEINWNAKDWGKQFVNKRIGVVYGEEEQEYDGNVSMRSVPKWFCSWDRVPDQKVPATKFLTTKPAAETAKSSDGFMNIPEGVDEEIPF